MTNKEAIDYVKNVIENSEKVIFAGQPVNEVKLYTTDEGVKMLKRVVELADRELCEDAISRQVAIKAIWDGTNMDIYTSEVKEILEGLSPVQPKAKSEWIPIKTRPLTEEEKAEMGTEIPYMYDCPLPDDGEEVEVITHLGDVAMDIFCRDPEGCYFEHYCDDGDVLAWRHKPEPYRSEK